MLLLIPYWKQSQVKSYDTFDTPNHSKTKLNSLHILISFFYYLIQTFYKAYILGPHLKSQNKSFDKIFFFLQFCRIGYSVLRCNSFHKMVNQWILIFLFSMPDEVVWQTDRRLNLYLLSFLVVLSHPASCSSDLGLSAHPLNWNIWHEQKLLQKQ